MIRAIAFALALLLLASPALATTYYASTGGSGTNCSQASPCSLTQLIATVQAGDVGIVNAGTYNGNFGISGKSGTASQRITLRAATPAVNCTDPVNDPDGCTVDTSSRTIITGGGFDLTGADADYWTIEGFEFQSRESLDCTGNSVASAPDHLTVRYIYMTEPSALGGQGILSDWDDCVNATIEHSYFWNPHTGGNGPDYAIRLWGGTQDFTARNIYCAGGFHYCVNARNYAGPRITLERIVCEGVELPCINLGPVMDRDTSGGPECSNPSGVNEQTVRDVTIRSMFARRATSGATSFPSRYGLSISNVLNLDAQDLFLANVDHVNTPNASIITQESTFSGDSETCEGANRIDPGNWSIRGVVGVAPASGQSCFRLFGVGYDVDLDFQNFVCHNAATAVVFGSCSTNCPETSAHANTTLQNGVMNDCTSNITGQNEARLTDSHNDFFNCGTSRGQTGDQTVDPQFVGPESVTNPEIDLSHGRALWDWGGTYRPIIDRFDTQQASLVNAGTGTADPCTGAACDIGVNEFFVSPATVWASCGVYQNGEEVFGLYTDPWIDGRSGLAIDVDCARKELVVGRCTDPLNEGTCDTDIYIHKSAQKRVRRLSSTISLNSGVTGGPEDTSGACWRTRATYTFTETLEALTGFWVRYEIDPDGGTHTCALPEWAWQGAE